MDNLLFIIIIIYWSVLSHASLLEKEIWLYYNER